MRTLPANRMVPALLQKKREQRNGKGKETTMEIKKSGSQPSGKAPAEHFTGTVRIDPLLQPTETTRALGASVTFEPWERPQLSKRDRSLITCAALVTAGKTEQMAFHFPRAIENGVTQEELVELTTHLPFYAGWPNAMSTATKAKELLGKK
jgi:alkylhydroperoxidase/carboxymuconolactone decarboxylase family protein YurZ